MQQPMQGPGPMYVPMPPHPSNIHPSTHLHHPSRAQPPPGSQPYLPSPSGGYPQQGPPPQQAPPPPQPPSGYMYQQQPHGTGHPRSMYPPGPNMAMPNQAQPPYDMSRGGAYAASPHASPQHHFDFPVSSGYRHPGPYPPPGHSPFARQNSVPQQMMPAPQQVMSAPPGPSYHMHHEMGGPQSFGPPGPQYPGGPPRRSDSMSMMPNNGPMTAPPNLRPQMSPYSGQLPSIRQNLPKEYDTDGRGNVDYRRSYAEPHQDDSPLQSPSQLVMRHGEREDNRSTSYSPARNTGHDNAMVSSFSRDNAFPPVTRRLAHSQSEQKRREVINEGFAALASVLPSARGGADSKATVLRKAVMHIEALHAQLENYHKGKLSSPSVGESRRQEGFGHETPGRPQPIHAMGPNELSSPPSAGPPTYPGSDPGHLPYHHYSRSQQRPEEGHMPVASDPPNRRFQEGGMYSTPRRDRMQGSGPYHPYGPETAQFEGQYTPSGHASFAYPPGSGSDPVGPGQQAETYRPGYPPGPDPSSYRPMYESSERVGRPPYEGYGGPNPPFGTSRPFEAQQDRPSGPGAGIRSSSHVGDRPSYPRSPFRGEYRLDVERYRSKQEGAGEYNPADRDDVQRDYGPKMTSASDLNRGPEEVNGLTSKPKDSDRRNTDADASPKGQASTLSQRESDAELLASAATAAKARTPPNLAESGGDTGLVKDQAGPGFSPVKQPAARDRYRPAESSERNEPLVKQEGLGRHLAHQEQDYEEEGVHRGQKRRQPIVDDGDDSGPETRSRDPERKKSAPNHRRIGSRLDKHERLHSD